VLVFPHPNACRQRGFLAARLSPPSAWLAGTQRGTVCLRGLKGFCLCRAAASSGIQGSLAARCGSNKRVSFVLGLAVSAQGSSLSVLLRFCAFHAKTARRRPARPKSGSFGVRKRVREHLRPAALCQCGWVSLVWLRNHRQVPSNASRRAARAAQLDLCIRFGSGLARTRGQRVCRSTVHCAVPQAFHTRYGCIRVGQQIGELRLETVILARCVSTATVAHRWCGDMTQSSPRVLPALFHVPRQTTW